MVDETQLKEVEARLLSEPFNLELRLELADLLREAARGDAAAQQYGLVTQQRPDAAPAWIGLARCQLLAGEAKTALESYTKAKNLEGFEPDDEMEAVARGALAQRAELNVVDDLSNVVALSAHRGDGVTFADVTGMTELKKLLRLQIIEPFRNPGLFQRFRKKAGGGVLLYGPPGCGKTLIARAIAGECNAEFQSVGISDVLSMWIGESERNLSLIFEQARSRKPCVLFFDELDALAYSRSKSSGSSARTVVNELLAQLDGFNDNNEGVLVLAATNMPWDVDPAMKRPGRFARQIFVPPPDDEAREEMLRNKMTGVPHAAIDFARIANAAAQYSGADVDGLIDMAKESVLSDILDSGIEREVAMQDFMTALEDMTPSTVDWLTIARNLVKFSGADNSYKDVEKYLRKAKKL